MRRISQVTIIGLGVIGGSLAKALKGKHSGLRIAGVDRTPVTDRAAAEGVIDEAFDPGMIKASLQGSSIVFLCTPVSTIIELLPLVGRTAGPGTVITDTGSTKRMITAAAADCLHRGCCFIGGHPLTGNEGCSYGWSDARLFENASYVLTQDAETPQEAMKTLVALLETIGARIVMLEAEAHDRIAAMVSHLPQLLAVSLMNSVAELNQGNDLHLKLAAGGFRDMTRIASSPWPVWNDIIGTNRDEIEAALDRFIDALADVKGSLNTDALAERFIQAARSRLSIPRDSAGFTHPGYDLRLWLEDRPGILAAITGVLAKHRINITDIEVLKVREGDPGTLRLSFAAKHIRDRAAALLDHSGFTTFHLREQTEPRPEKCS